jgi:WD40 repeat protein
MEGQTIAGAIVGSPAYLAPEQIKSEPVTLLADIYSLGIMLYELLTGKRPFQAPNPAALLQKHLTELLPPLTAQRPDLPAPLDLVIRRATAKDPAGRYPNVLALLSDFQQALVPSDDRPLAPRDQPVVPKQAAPTVVLELSDADNPYKGLRAFREADAATFFGREALTQQLLGRLAEEGDLARFLAVVGSSGSGKSSAVRAGLIPALRRGGLSGSERWFVVDLLPGAHPLEELEAALLRIAVNPPESLLAQLREDTRGLLRAIKRVLPADETVELVLIIDQFEEVFTLVDDEAARAHLLDSLVAAVLDERSRVRLVITLRADFIDRPLQYVDFGELVRQQAELILPLASDELERAIVGPAEQVGLALEAGLVPTIVHDVEAQPGALPLLQYALTELFERREGRALTRAAYQASGGVTGALARRADELFEQLDVAGQEAARQLFLRLVTLGEGTEDTRRRVLRSELATTDHQLLTTNQGDTRYEIRGMQNAQVSGLLSRVSQSEQSSVVGRWSSVVDQVIDVYGRYRLLAFDHDPITREPTIEVAHEALIRGWGRLRVWLEASREQLRVQRRLAAAAAEWDHGSRDPSFLATGARLAQFAALAEAVDPSTGAEPAVALNAVELAFLDASQAAAVEEERRQEAMRQRELEQAQALAEAERRRAEEQAAARGRLRRRALFLAGALVLALVAAALAGVFGVQSQQSAAEAQAQQSTAVAERSRAERNAAEAQAQRDLAQTAQAQTQVQLDIAESLRLADLARSQLGDAPETALLLAYEAAARNDNPQSQHILHDTLYQHVRPVSVLTGHTESVNSAIFSPDGQRILTASFDGTARLWGASGTLLATLQGHTAPITSTEFSPNRTRILTATIAEFSPDGQRILTVSGDGMARLWDANGQPLATLQGHTDRVRSAVFSPDGMRILTAAYDRTARLWDLSGKPLTILQGHTDRVYDAVFSPDGGHILTASKDQTARLWNLSGNLLATLQGHTSPLVSAVFSPDGQSILTTSEEGMAQLWDVSGQPIATLQGAIGVFSPNGQSILTTLLDDKTQLWYPSGQQITTVQGDPWGFSPDGQRILTASANGTVSLWRVADGALLRTLEGHTDVVESAEFSPDGQRILTASRDETARLWDLSGKRLATLHGRIGVFSADGQRILTASFDGTARLWYTNSTELSTLRGHMGAVTSAEFSPDGQHILTASYDNTARLWDLSGTPLATLQGHTNDVTSALFSPNGERILTTSDDHTARLWDMSGQPLATLQGHTDAVMSAMFSPDGAHILTTSKDRTARLWDRSGNLLATLQGHTSSVVSAVFSPNGQRILTGSVDKTARLWDLSGRLLAILQGHTEAVTSAEFSPDGQRMLTASFDKTARLWDAGGAELAIFSGHSLVVWSAEFSPDGRHILTASLDGTARLWDASGKLLTILQGHIGEAPNRGAASAMFSPDGQRILTASDDKTARLWDATGAPLATLQGHTDVVYRAVFSPDGRRILTSSQDGTARQYLVNVDDLLAVAACRVGRGLTDEEIARFQVPTPLRFDFAKRQCPPSVAR